MSKKKKTKKKMKKEWKFALWDFYRRCFIEIKKDIVRRFTDAQYAVEFIERELKSNSQGSDSKYSHGDGFMVVDVDNLNGRNPDIKDAECILIVKDSLIERIDRK